MNSIVLEIEQVAILDVRAVLEEALVVVDLLQTVVLVVLLLLLNPLLTPAFLLHLTLW